jgi:hypothetical protein
VSPPISRPLEQVNAIVWGLPATSFSTVEGAKEHFWEWWTEAEAVAHGGCKLRRRRRDSKVVNG